LRITLLLERAGLWRRYADLLHETGKDTVPALVASRRDHDDALNLQAAAEGR
jgi:hypothetical protein